MCDSRIDAIIVAGGRGLRMGGDMPKQYQMLAGEPVLCRTLKAFQMHELIDSIVLVVHADDIDYCRDKVLKGSCLPKLERIVVGGAERSDSVRAGLVATNTKVDGIVLIHDAVRPFVSSELIDRVIIATREHGAAVPCLPVTDTIKQVVDGEIQSTLLRHEIFRSQTPQGFRRNIIFDAHKPGNVATDDAELVEQLGHKVVTINGDEENVKLTTSSDLIWARAFIDGDNLGDP